jgi:integrase
VRAATRQAKRVASTTRSILASASAPSPRSLHQPTNPPPNASPATIVSTTLARSRHSDLRGARDYQRAIRTPREQAHGRSLLEQLAHAHHDGQVGLEVAEVLLADLEHMAVREHSPQTGPESRPRKVYRLTRAEAAAFLAAAQTVRERRIADIGICAGARNGELRGLQGRHFQRSGWVWISADIAKGGRQRWIPVLPELEPIAREIRETVAVDEYVIPAQRWRDPGANSCRGDLLRRPSSSQALRTAVMELAVRAGIHAHVHRT